MGVDEPTIDSFAVGSSSDGLVGLHLFELGFELEAAGPPVVERDVTAADRSEPVGGLWEAVDTVLAWMRSGPLADAFTYGESALPV